MKIEIFIHIDITKSNVNYFHYFEKYIRGEF